ncbi:MAG TPA: hypothetical protein VJS38_15965, partial [Phenylobacterium sp.]|uniref:hypothetical protein n=1 Tax=Phenylobacterium sp. TaxID=1871053 RepID=UPI002B48D968
RAVRLEHRLGDIQTDGGNLAHGRLPRVKLNTSLWHADAVGGRPPHHLSGRVARTTDRVFSWRSAGTKTKENANVSARNLHR